MAKTIKAGMKKSFKESATSPWGNTLPTRQPLMAIKLENIELIGRAELDDMIEKIENEYVDLQLANAREADEALPKICADLTRIANDDLLQMANPEPAITRKAFIKGERKKKERIFKKTRDEKDGSFEDITDYSRCTISAKTPAQIGTLASAIEYCIENGIELQGGARIVKFENRLETPTSSRYRSGKALVAIPLKSGSYHISEIMITHEGFERDIKNEKVQAKLKRDVRQLDIKIKELMKDSHKVYEWVRQIEERYRKTIMPNDVAITYGVLKELVGELHDAAAEENLIGDRQIDFAFYRALRTRNAAYKLSHIAKELRL